MCAQGEAQKVSVWSAEVNFFTCRSAANQEQGKECSSLDERRVSEVILYSPLNNVVYNSEMFSFF